MESIQYFSDKSNQLYGAVVRTDEGVGWSILHPLDRELKKFETTSKRKSLLKVARGRAHKFVIDPITIQATELYHENSPNRPVHKVVKFTVSKRSDLKWKKGITLPQFVFQTMMRLPHDKP